MNERKRLTTSDFIDRSIVIHQNKYDYSKTTIITGKTKAIIICPIHGGFEQIPANHLNGAGCPVCGRIESKLSQRYSTKDFIESVIPIHGSKYDYKNVKYVNSQIKVEIICKKHGEFQMKPNSHFNGQGCPKCGREDAKENIKIDYSIFLERAEKIHQNKYEYLQSSYIDYTTKMKMFCSEHGVFDQKPHSHISMRSGCPLCGNLKAGLSNQKGWDAVHDLFLISHQDKYVYDINSFIDVSKKMRIQCPEHGWFEQKPFHHYNGHGCKKCANQEIGLNRRLTLKEFYIKAKEKHGDRYGYEKIQFINIFTPIEITCKKHGDFSQAPVNHYNGSGCPKCISSRGENNIRLILEESNIVFEEQKTFEGLRMTKKLKCDFFLPHHNLVIEYNGLQHYEPIEIFGGVLGLEQTQKRDLLKYSYLALNNIRLVIVRYDNKDVLNYLMNKLNSEKGIDSK